MLRPLPLLPLTWPPDNDDGVDGGDAPVTDRPPTFNDNDDWDCDCDCDAAAALDDVTAVAVATVNVGRASVVDGTSLIFRWLVRPK
jgi:hypothetical protein